MRKMYIAAVAFLALALAASGSAQTINIGFTVSRTGSLNVEAMEQLHGYELWRDQVNAAGGIKAGGKSYQVKFASYDDESNPQRVQQLYTRLVVQDKSDFLLGPYSSGLTATAAIVSEQNRRIMITTGAAEEKTYTLGNKYLFQVFISRQSISGQCAGCAESQGPERRVALVYGDDSFSTAVGYGRPRLCAEAGIEDRLR